jgi:hypothetical protein
MVLQIRVAQLVRQAFTIFGRRLISIVGFIIFGQTFGTLRRTRWQFIFVVTLMALFLGLNATVNQHTPARAVAFVGIASAMVGATNCIGTLIVQLGAKDEDIGLATGLLNSVRAVGGGVGVTIYSSLLKNRIASTWAVDIGDAVVKAGLPASSVASFLGKPSAEIWEKKNNKKMADIQVQKVCRPQTSPAQQISIQPF